MKRNLSRLLAAMTCAASLSVYAANDADTTRPIKGKHTPPQAAIDACKNQVEKATCQFRMDIKGCRS